MKKLLSSITIATLAAAVLLATPATSSAQDKGKDKAAEKDKGGEQKKAGTLPFNGKAVAVDKAAKTIKLSGEKGRMVQVTATTKVLKEGKPAAFDDLKEGEDVSGGYKMSADGKMEATVLNIGKAPAKTEKKKEDKK